MFHAGCGIHCNIADHPANIKFMQEVGVRAVRMTALRERFAKLQVDLVDNPIKQFFHSAR